MNNNAPRSLARSRIVSIALTALAQETTWRRDREAEALALSRSDGGVHLKNGSGEVVATFASRAVFEAAKLVPEFFSANERRIPRMRRSAQPLGVCSSVMADDKTRAVVHCEQCKQPRPGIPRGSYQQTSPGGSWWGVEYTLMECAVCSKPFVVESHSPWYDDIGYIDDKCWSPPEQILPLVDEAVDDSVPANIAKSYQEARRSLRGQNFMAAALLCRRAIELVCKHFEAGGKWLPDKVTDLHARAIIDHRMRDWSLHVLRYHGNNAAHDDTEEVSSEDAADAVAFTKAIIWHLFVFEAAYKEHMDRRIPKPPRVKPTPNAPGAFAKLKAARGTSVLQAKPEQAPQSPPEPQQSTPESSPTSDEE